jgi:hypothetical protein
MFTPDDDASRLGDAVEDDADYEDDDIPEPARVTYRASGSDPTFGFLVAIALSVGLAPLIPENADLRYAVVWTVLGAFGVLAWLLGETDRIEKETLENLVWGVVFGLILGTPMLLAGGDTLATTVHLVFRTGIGGEIHGLPFGTVLMILIFAMPTAETLFFRGLMQHGRAFWLVGVLSSVWSILLFLPMIEVVQYPAVAIIIGTVLTMMNFMYSYVRRRNGLAAAWLCQITVNLVLLFIPFISQ